MKSSASLPRFGERAARTPAAAAARASRHKRTKPTSTKVDVSVGGAALRLLLHLAERPSLRGKMRAAGVPGGTLAALEAAAAYQPSKEEEEAKAKLAELDAMDNDGPQPKPNAPADAGRVLAHLYGEGGMTTVDDQAGSAALERAAPVIAEEVVATARLALAYCRAGGGDTSRAELRRAFVAARAMAAEPRCRKALVDAGVGGAIQLLCDEAVGTAHVVGAPPLMGEVVVGAGVLRRCAGSGGGGGGGGKGGSSGGGDAMELRRKLQQEGAAAAVRDAAMRLSAANSTPGSGAAGSSWLTATADGAITLAAQLALDALEGKHDAGASGGAALANSEKKNSPQGVATDMQLIDAAPRAHAFIAYAGAGGFDLAESLHALLVPAMYSSVVADADGPPLNGAKEKGRGEGGRRVGERRRPPDGNVRLRPLHRRLGRRRAQVGANGQAARRRGVVRDACRPRPSRRRRRARPR